MVSILHTQKLNTPSENIYNNIKRKFFLIFSVFIVLLVCFPTYVNADPPPSVQENVPQETVAPLYQVTEDGELDEVWLDSYTTPGNKKNLDSFARTVFTSAYDVYSGKSLMTDKVKDYLNIDFANTGEGDAGGTNYKSVWNTVKTVYDAIKVTGILLLTLFWLTDLLDKVQSDSFTLEHFVRASIKLIVGFMLMNNGLTIVQGLVTFSNEIFSKISDVSLAQGGSANVTILNEIWEDCIYYTEHKFMGSFAMIGWYLKLIIPSIMMLLIKIVLYVILYSRIIELAARMVFAPIGMANIYNGGMNSSGIRYLKKIAAVALTGCVILVSLYAYNTLVGIVNSNGTGVFENIILGVSSIMIVIKAQGWSNDIMGV